MAMRLLYYIGKNYISNAETQQIPTPKHSKFQRRNTANSNAGTQQIPTQKHSKLRRFPVQFAENWEADIASHSGRF